MDILGILHVWFIPHMCKYVKPLNPILYHETLQQQPAKTCQKIHGIFRRVFCIQEKGELVPPLEHLSASKSKIWYDRIFSFYWRILKKKVKAISTPASGRQLVRKILNMRLHSQHGVKHDHMLYSFTHNMTLIILDVTTYNTTLIILDVTTCNS